MQSCAESIPYHGSQNDTAPGGSQWGPGLSLTVHEARGGLGAKGVPVSQHTEALDIEKLTRKVLIFFLKF